MKTGTLIMVAYSQEELDEGQGIVKPLIGFYNGLYYDEKHGTGL